MTSRSSGIHVFLADGSPAIRERVSAMLTAQGMHVDGQAGTPQDCTAKILAARPDVVVLDVQLEGGSGMEVLNAVRAAAPEIAFVVFSNDSSLAYRSRYLSQGAVGFVDKSSESSQLAAAVEAAACERAIG
jgi:two-component system response regulator DesR